MYGREARTKEVFWQFGYPNADCHHHVVGEAH